MPFNYNDLIAVSPILFLSAYSLLLLIIDASLKKPANLVFWLTLLGLVISGLLTLYTYNASGIAFNGTVFTGRFPAFFEVIFLLSSALSVLLSKPYLEKEKINHGEYYSLVVFATVGMMLMASARDMMVLFLGLELMSISL